ncbi:MAG: hypothetical protein EP330_01010 [Deltaproteobacteria bacterium]|nr:MAG: hypothetical protein EP330_01010 [Deltaproteobacteria bacterium]
MFRTLALALFLAPTAFASDLGDLVDLPEAEVTVEDPAAGAIDLSDEDDFEFEADKPNAVPATEAPAATTAELVVDEAPAAAAPTRASFAPAPDLPSVDHVEFEDDFEFETASPKKAAAPTRSESKVEFVDLDGEVETPKAEKVEEEEVRPELDEFEVLEGLEDEPVKATDKTPVGDVEELLSDDDDIDLDW